MSNAESIAEPMTLIVDTRERHPWTFPSIATRRAKLEAGDYSVAGLEGRVAVERKELSDLIGTLTRSRRRFTAELRALARMRYACVVVEASVSDVLAGNYRAEIEPTVLLAMCAGVEVTYGVPVHWAGSRAAAAALAESILRAAWRKANRRG